MERFDVILVAMTFAWRIQLQMVFCRRLCGPLYFFSGNVPRRVYASSQDTVVEDIALLKEKKKPETCFNCN